MVHSARGRINQRNEPLGDAEIAHGHQQAVSEDRLGLDAAEEVFADVVERFEVKNPPVEFGLDPFGLFKGGTEPD
jgi:hypothetical protein